MSLARKTLIELAICVGLFGAAGIALLSAEIRWARINSPVGKFTSAAEYLSAGRLPSRVTKLATNGRTFFIAYSPMDRGWALPSGPAAYVFDDSGRMVTWTRDTGDDGRWQKQWPLGEQEKSSIEDLQNVAGCVEYYIGFRLAEQKRAAYLWGARAAPYLFVASVLEFSLRIQKHLRGTNWDYYALGIVVTALAAFYFWLYRFLANPQTQQLLSRSTEPGASPNVGPAGPLGNSGVAGGPPSVTKSLK